MRRRTFFSESNPTTYVDSQPPSIAPPPPPPDDSDDELSASETRVAHSRCLSHHRAPPLKVGTDVNCYSVPSSTNTSVSAVFASSPISVGDANGSDTEDVAASEGDRRGRANAFVAEEKQWYAGHQYMWAVATCVLRDFLSRLCLPCTILSALKVGVRVGLYYILSTTDTSMSPAFQMNIDDENHVVSCVSPSTSNAFGRLKHRARTNISHTCAELLPSPEEAALP